jgi:hypothetical protein
MTEKTDLQLRAIDAALSTAAPAGAKIAARNDLRKRAAEAK